jgi:chitin-binding protein
VWQRSDSPEAFYSCSDVTFGGAESGSAGNSAGGSAPVPSAPAPSAPSASAPSEEQIEEGADKSTIEHHGHGDDDPATTTDPDPASAEPASPDPAAEANEPKAAGAGAGESLAETGGDGSTPYLAVGGAAVLALGAGVLFASVRRRAVGGGRSGR